MDMTGLLLDGFATALALDNVVYCFIGVFIGTLIGVLPGIGPVAAMSILLPGTFGLSPVAALILLSGIYYGAMYGGSITSILVNIPGEAASVVTCLDGYQMAKQGRAGVALGISALGSFIGGTVSLFGLLFLVVPLAKFVLAVGPPEYLALMCLGMTVVTYLAKGSFNKAVIMTLAGLILGTVGTDIVTGVYRYTFDVTELLDGINIAPMAMGLFGVAEVLSNLERPLKEKTQLVTEKIKNLWPTREDWRRSALPMLRGSVLGFFLGILPGGGTIISSFASYTVEKKLARHPERFGRGAIEGVAGPETANNAATSGGFVPLLTLGIPPNVILSLLMAALLIHGVTPGPMLLKERPELFFGTVASMYVGNSMLLLLNLPLIGMWVKVLKVPAKLLFPFILLFTLIGAYTIQGNAFDVLVLCFFGVMGYLLRKFDYEEAPMLLAFILGPLLEQAFRQSLAISRGSLMIFVERPVAAVTLALTVVILLLSLVGAARHKLTAHLEDQD